MTDQFLEWRGREVELGPTEEECKSPDPDDMDGMGG